MEATINGLRTHYTLSGEGERFILLLHGWGSDMSVYSDTIKALESDYKVLALDLPGFGRTQEPEKPWSVDDYVEFVIKFAEYLGINELSLVGHSFGGRIIIKLASRKNPPLTIDKIVLIDSAGILPQKTFKSKVRGFYYKICKKIMETRLVKYFYPDALERLRNRHGSEDYKNATPVMRATLVSAVNEDLSGYLPHISRPTLLIWGDMDTATPISDAVTMNKLIPDSGLVTLKGAGHYSFLEQSYTYISVMKSFFNCKEEA